MGVRGELFSTKVSLQNRTYFFNIKENRLGDLYLNIVESKNRETGGFERQSVILFADDLTEFLQGFDESLRVLEKAVREKKKGVPRAQAEKPGGGPVREKKVFIKKGEGRAKNGAQHEDSAKARKSRAVKAVHRKAPF
jgi:hypothetical protein